jgi:hypothetical protein
MAALAGQHDFKMDTQTRHISCQLIMRDLVLCSSPIIAFLNTLNRRPS